MGSDSDLQIMRQAQDILNEFNVPHDVKIVSAHRTAQRMIEYSRKAKSRGFKVIIAGAGGAAHLPGMVAAVTPLPVIGVPIRTAHLQGLDSLLSVAQMPPGVPVATVAINGAKNAGILACQILAVGHPEIARQVEKYRKDLQEMVLAKAQRLEKVGVEKYLKRLQAKNQQT